MGYGVTTVALLNGACIVRCLYIRFVARSVPSSVVASMPRLNCSVTCAAMHSHVVLKKYYGAYNIHNHLIIGHSNTSHVALHAGHSLCMQCYALKDSREIQVPNVAISNIKQRLHDLTANYAMVPSSLISSGYMSGIATYAALEMFAESGENASLSAIGRVTSLTRPTVRKARDWLVKEGYITIQVHGNGRTTTQYTLTGQVTPRGKEILPQGANNFTPDVPETDTETVTSNSNKVTSNSNSKTSNSKLVSSTPDWFAPLTTLEGYKNKDYKKSIVAIEQVCSSRGVLPQDVVREFIDYYPIGRATRNWREPVPALIRTLNVQVSKLEGKGKSIDRTSSNSMTLEEELAFHRDTGIRPSSVQADAIRADWLKKYRGR